MCGRACVCGRLLSARVGYRRVVLACVVGLCLHASDIDGSCLRVWSCLCVWSSRTEAGDAGDAGERLSAAFGGERERTASSPRDAGGTTCVVVLVCVVVEDRARR